MQGRQIGEMVAAAIFGYKGIVAGRGSPATFPGGKKFFPRFAALKSFSARSSYALRKKSN